MEKELIETLPFTKELKNEKWSFLYTYNLRTLRDIFVYCDRRNKIKRTDLYEDLKNNVIHPPKDRWVNWKNKNNDRLRLEYIHAAEYLGLTKREHNFILPDFSEFEEEKRSVISENENREFTAHSTIRSPPFSEKEKHALLKIILNFERARDFLRWFMDFSEFKDIYSFDEKIFLLKAKPILILGKIPAGKKARNILKREIDGKIWKIPVKDPYDYTRLVSFVLPSWFKDLGLIDEVIVFPEFSGDGKLWHMYYPITMGEKSFLELDLLEFVEALSNEKKGNRLWTPYLIYSIARKFSCPVNAIKAGFEKIYKQNRDYVYFERAPAHLMKSFYMDSYIEIGGFYRSYLDIERGSENGKE